MFSIYSVIPLLLYKNWVVDRHELLITGTSSANNRLKHTNVKFSVHRVLHNGSLNTAKVGNAVCSKQNKLNYFK